MVSSPDFPHADRPRPLLNILEVAALLRLSPRSVRRLIADGRLKVVRLGRAVRVRQEDLSVLLDGSGQ